MGKVVKTMLFALRLFGLGGLLLWNSIVGLCVEQAQTKVDFSSICPSISSLARLAK